MTDRTLPKNSKPIGGREIDWPELDAPDLSSLSASLAHATAMISHTYSQESYCGFCQLDPEEQKNYFWAIHARLKVASKALGRVMSRRRFETAQDAARFEEVSRNG